jgi:hypothetical protein
LPHRFQQLATKKDVHTFETAMRPGEGIETAQVMLTADPEAGTPLALGVGRWRSALLFTLKPVTIALSRAQISNVSSRLKPPRSSWRAFSSAGRAG